MELATQTHLASLRALLTVRLTELRADLDAAEMAAENAHASTPSVEEVHDTKDAATQASSAGVQMAEAQRDADELGLVKAALRRLDSGTYGDCLDCGEPIPLARLWVQPAAARCTRCQAGFESGRTTRG